MQEIVIAFGCEIRDGRNHRAIEDFLGTDATPAGPGAWTYPKQAPTHRIRMIYTKAEFATALDAAGAVVVYDGHSRMGQGPAFGPPSLPRCPDAATFPINPWADCFRMGHALADVECVDDILRHGTDPAEYAVPASTKGMQAPQGLVDVVSGIIKAGKGRCGSRGAWRRLVDCHPDVAATKSCRGQSPLATRHYWRSRGDGREFDTLVAVGDTDLVGTKLACAALFVNSCSSKRHFHAALSRHRKSVKSACVFFLTADVCSSATTLPFVKAVLAGQDVTGGGQAAILRRMNALRGSGFISAET